MFGFIHSFSLTTAVTVALSLLKFPSEIFCIESRYSKRAWYDALKREYCGCLVTRIWIRLIKQV